MTYGNKFILIILFISLFIIGCNNYRNYHIILNDNYKLMGINNKVYLYRDNNKFNINNKDSNILKFKYNEDIISLMLDDNKYYMIYMIDGTIYGPFDEESLKVSEEALDAKFIEDFISVDKLEGKIYE